MAGVVHVQPPLIGQGVECIQKWPLTTGIPRTNEQAKLSSEGCVVVASRVVVVPTQGTLEPSRGPRRSIHFFDPKKATGTTGGNGR